MNELQKVLEELDGRDVCVRSGDQDPEGIARFAPDALCADAARLLREMAADFDHWAYWHAEGCEDGTASGDLCTCGLDAARAKWRLTE
jgi:hypothetical protein